MVHGIHAPTPLAVCVDCTMNWFFLSEYIKDVLVSRLKDC